MGAWQKRCGGLAVFLLIILSSNHSVFINANRELITRMEAKIQATLARVWG